ncbi:MAG: SUMF1/EgtB/PvdO family nonheme iron enzyme [Flavobacteriales bacterium]|nr:SUMF1/EgtB/PvdO family nonheme iron enzyme [Flavobacteriales bacterium]
MKKILLLGVIAATVFSSCGTSSRGELVGVQELSEFYPSDPYGMVKIPRGTFTMGANDGDVPYAHTTPKKLVTMHSFYMDQTEITNNEYRQFVHWVRDSIARTLLAEGMVEGYEYIEETPDGEFLDNPYLNWDADIDWDGNEEIELTLEEMYLPLEEQIMGQKGFDTRSWSYKYSWVDKSPAAKKANRFDPETGTYREGFSRQNLVHDAEVYVYPDTLVWMSDFSYTFNEPMFDTYFWHPAYGEYPLVGVNWEQATAFCHWRTDLRMRQLTSYQQKYETEFRLPTDAEWEYAARGGKEHSIYPWGGPYSRNSKGCFLANFKPVRGNYIADGYAFTAPSESYWRNDYDLFNMSGNVSEWTSTPFEPTASMFVSDMNPFYTYNADENAHPMLKRKVVKGGSWKDVGAFLQVAAKDYEYQDTSKCYIGFRCVKTYAGVETVDFGY